MDSRAHTNAGTREPGHRRVLQFRHLSLENWRNFTRIDVDVQRRAFLIGANASGKSNLLDVFRFLHDLVAVGGGFGQAIRKRGGISRLRSLSARRYPDVAIHVQVGDEHATLWEYVLRFGQDNRQRPIIKQEMVIRAGETILDRPDQRDKEDLERLTQTYLEQVHANQPFREVADFFATIHYLHIVPQVLREPNRSIDRTDDPYGGDFIEQLVRTPHKTQRARLQRITDALQVAVPQLRELELTRDARGAPHLRGKYEHWRAQDAWLDEDQFSDGTLRLIGLLWAILDGTGPLLLEEPELSLHSEVVRYLPSVFAAVQRRSRRQIIVSTHAREMLQDEGIGLDEVLVLIPSAEGTTVAPAGTFDEVPLLVEKGVSLADAVMPRTAPARVEHLALFEN